MSTYILLRIDNDFEANVLMGDMTAYPDDALLTPTQENRVHAKVVYAIRGEQNRDAVVATEMELLADELEQVQTQMREEDDRTIRSSGLGEAVRRIRERVTELRNRPTR